MIVKSSVMDILVMGMSPQGVVCKLYLEAFLFFVNSISHQTFDIFERYSHTGGVHGDSAP